MAEPRFSIVTPVYETPAGVLRAMLRSVRRQRFGDWELCLVDDASSQPHVARDPRGGRARGPAHPGPAPRARTAASSPPPTTRWRWPAASSSSCSTTTTSSTPTPWPTSTRRSRPTPRPTTSTPTKTRSTATAATPGPSSSPTGRRSGCGPRCTPAISASCGGPWSRRWAASIPSSRAPRTGTSCSRSPSGRAQVVHVPRVLYHWRTLETSTAGGGEEAKPWAFEARHAGGAGPLRAHRAAGPRRARPRRPGRLPPAARRSSASRR